MHFCPAPDCLYIGSAEPAKPGKPTIMWCEFCRIEYCVDCRKEMTKYHRDKSCETAAKMAELAKKREAQRKRVAEKRRMKEMTKDTSTYGEAEQIIYTVEDNDDNEEATRQYLATLMIRKCAKCGTAATKDSGCEKMQCRCGYRYCFRCGTENATCSCTPASHGFIDPITGRGMGYGERTHYIPPSEI